MQSAQPSISIIVEWENALLSELDRARAMLRRLREQAEQQALPLEILVLFNPEQIRQVLIITELDAAFPPGGKLSYRIEPAQGLHYYDLKNFGARLAAGDIIVFLDSDVIPEDGWLSSILQPLLADETVQVVAGTSYIDPVDFVGRAFALSWLFPLRSKHQHVDKNAKAFHANNLALRKAFFLEHPFPAMPAGVTRGACSQLASNIRASGNLIYRQHAARVSHPPPNGLTHTLVRAIAEGRDATFRSKSPGKGSLALLWGVVRKFVRKIFNRAIFRTIRDHNEVSMPLWQVPGAVLLMTGYYLLALIGGVMAVLLPGFMEEHFKV